MAPQREWFEKDYYAILGVAETAEIKDITRAYRKLARANHPDAKPDDAAAEERFKEISAAYDVIGDAERRKEYDEVRKMGPVGTFGGGGGPGGGGFAGPGGFTFNVDDMGAMGGIGDVLGNLFGGGGGRGRGSRRATTGPQRGGDLEAALHLDFVDAVNGITTALHLVSDASCHTCSGTGAEPGTTPTTCPTCAGRGIVQDDQGMFATTRPCPTCGGRGVRIDHPCKTCRGTGVERRPREVKVRIPAGVKDGQRIRLKGRGDPGRNGGPAGDLFVVCSVEPHALFAMAGRNLRAAVPITFPEAVLGADITVPTLDAGTVKVRIPAGTRPGKTFRVKGRGVPSAKGTGDLLVTVEVAVPSKLSDEERAAVEALAAAATESPRDHLEVPS
ncbi:MAG: molecular chaperone DnaJ [Acidimicrobiales bacterium]